VVPALYEADVTHTRSSPLSHHFRYRATYWLVDLDKLPQPRGLAGWCTQVRSQDHVDIRHLLAERGVAADRVLMLSGARTFGYVFNPISVFWCHDDTNNTCTLVAEVRNTYGDCYAYVLEPDAAGVATTAKAMRVSPFNAGGGTYRIKITDPAAAVSVSVRLERPGEKPFVATLHGMRQSLTLRTVFRSVVRHSSARTRMLIQLQGLGLRGRGLKVQPR
jgi:DUF1365 family protein